MAQNMKNMERSSGHTEKQFLYGLFIQWGHNPVLNWIGSFLQQCWFVKSRSSLLGWPFPPLEENMNTPTHTPCEGWIGWVIVSYCLQCYVFARSVIAPFAVCNNGVNGISSELCLCPSSVHLARGWAIDACGFVCWWPAAYASSGF